MHPELQAVKDHIMEAGDVCYTCWEVEDGCECCEDFDSTLARERDNHFDEGDGPRSVEEVADAMVKTLGEGLGLSYE